MKFGMIILNQSIKIMQNYATSIHIYIFILNIYIYIIYKYILYIIYILNVKYI